MSQKDQQMDEREFLLRQAGRESGGNPNAISSTGAMGWGQFMQDTWSEFQKYKNDFTLSPFNPLHAIEAQKWLMDKLGKLNILSPLNSSVENKRIGQLAAYNWGQGHLSNLFNKLTNRGVDISDPKNWIDHLPNETQKYISDIMYGTNQDFENTYKNKVLTSPYAKLYGEVPYTLPKPNIVIPKVNNDYNYVS